MKKPENVLADGYAADFAAFVADDEDYAQLIMDKALEYTRTNLSMMDEDCIFEVAMLLSDKLFAGKI